jgi:hypothetical protein
MTLMQLGKKYHPDGVNELALNMLMKQSPAHNANSCLASQEIPCLLWK